MKALRFPQQFVTWVVACVCSAHYSLVVNGETVGYITGRKGLRQGDPQSPLLFVLVMEYLTRILAKATTTSRFCFHPSCKQLKISSLCFADDLLLFSKGTLQSVQCLLDAFRTFSITSGLNANLSKSSIYFGGVNEGVQTSILQISGFSKGDFPMRYLGVPLSPKKWSKLDCTTVVNKITEKISSLSARSLSYAGGTVLVKSVLEAMSSYWASFFVLPASINKEVDKRCRDFLWGRTEDHKRTPLVSWQIVCSQKSKGGLGLRECRVWNLALLGRQVWEIEERKTPYGSNGLVRYT